MLAICCHNLFKEIQCCIGQCCILKYNCYTITDVAAILDSMLLEFQRSIHTTSFFFFFAVKRIQMTRRQSVGRGLQLTPGIGGMVST